MVLIEDRIRWPKGWTAQQRLGAATEPRLESRHLALTTMGSGCSRLLYKSLGAHHCVALETGNMQLFDVHRHQVLTFLADQGVDFDIPISPQMISDRLSELRSLIARARAGTLDATGFTRAVLYPYCVRLCDALHVYFGASRR
jgi:hypothetical protein